jgi:hypothetical protein
MVENFQTSRAQIDLAIAILADVDIDAARRNYSSYSNSSVDFHHPAFGNYLNVPLYHNPEELSGDDPQYLIPFKWGQYVNTDDLLPNSRYNDKANQIRQHAEANNLVDRLLLEGVATELILKIVGVADTAQRPGLLLRSNEQRESLHWGAVVRQAVGN